MVYLVFTVGDEQYGIPSPDIVEVLPVLRLHLIPKAPDYIVGTLNYHEDLVPVIDMSDLMSGGDSRDLPGTRIVVATFAHDDHRTCFVGLLVEDAVETISIADDRLREPVVDVTSAPFLGKIATESGGYIQLIEVTQLLPESVRELLYPLAERAIDAAG